MDDVRLLCLVNEHLSSREIAALLGVSQSTVMHHLRRLNTKTIKLKKDKTAMPHCCRYCKTEFKTGYSLGSHVRGCKLNPKYADRCANISARLKGKPLPPETKDKIRVSMRLAVKEGRQRTPKPGGICKAFSAVDSSGNVVNLHGSWEKKVADFLTSKNEEWYRNTKSFYYEFNGASHRYTPDFYIPRLNSYVEVKGYKTEKDNAKWKAFTERLIVLRGDDIKNLEKWYGALV